MKSLLKDLDSKAGKIAYQSYIFEHGIEKLTILIPLKDASAFQTAFANCEQKTKKSLLEVVTRFAGKVKG